MKFYEIDSALQQAKNAGDEPVRLKVEIDFGGHFETVFEHDIIEANFFGLKEVAGGTTARGELIISNELKTMSNGRRPWVGSEVRVSFSIGDGLPYFQRFRFFIDDRGIQDIQGPGRKRYVRIGLQDLSAKLRKTDEAKDWTFPTVFAYSVVCDKTQPEKSLLHCIAKRANFSGNDIDCSTVPVALPYVRLRRNVWAELSSLATAYRCHLECPVEKPLVFAHSPYQSEPYNADDISYTFTGEDIFYLRKTARAELYRNSVRLKVNMPVSLEKQEIWRYDEPPVFYDAFLQAHYPFKYPLVREIEAGKYEAKYSIIDTDGKKRAVVYADEIDTKEDAENRLDFDNGPFSYSYYDVKANYDKAILTLRKKHDGDLYKAAIFGRPIVLDLNRSFFLTESTAVKQYGTVALNVSGSYFSEYEINGMAQYEDWVIRELAERLQYRREFTVKTHRALFNARVGAKVQITMNNEKGTMNNGRLMGTINAFAFRYKRDKAFVASFRILEGGDYDC
jgi:hypothetical protein